MVLLWVAVAGDGLPLLWVWCYNGVFGGLVWCFNGVSEVVVGGCLVFLGG